MGWFRLSRAARVLVVEVVCALFVAAGLGLVVGALLGATAGVGISLVALGTIGFVFVIAYERGANAG